MSGRQFDVVFMDFYGTVAAGDRHIVEQTCERVIRDQEMSITARELADHWGREFFRVADESNHQQFRNLFECECLSLINTLQHYQVTLAPADYVRPMRDYFRQPPLHSDAQPAMNRLVELGVPICCISNIDEEDLQAAIRHHALPFTDWVSSEAARSYKPDRRIFEQALAQTQVAPQRALHVGDSLHSDIGGARAVGITAVWIERDGRISDIGRSAPDRRVSSLLELEEIVKFGCR
ncbi:MAG: hypothetical protein HJJLKODD_02295 [Phycisphaerae bacterium]|nr:hypothetical protein [Phycisphaerae bacterium]